MRLVNAEKLENSFELSIESWSRDCNSNAPAIANTYKMALKRVKEEPTIDAVEVVRCKDCKRRYVPARCALWYATMNGKEYFVERGENFYCSYGERKTEQ